MFLKRVLFITWLISCLAWYGCDKSTEGEEVDKQLPEWKSGQIIMDSKGWFEVKVGDIPIVISVPHGGNIRSDQLPNREGCSGAVVVLDSYTLALADAVEKQFLEKYNLRPTIVKTYLSRRHIDQNRDLAESICEDHPEMISAWHWYHNHLDSAVRWTSEKHNQVLFIDLHAHGHSNQRLELGYGLTIAEIGKVYSGIELEELMTKSTMANYKNINKDVGLQDLLIGDEAFGTLMHTKGVPSVPSKQNPYLMSNEDYFNGGYNSRFYTSVDYPKSYGWQIEVNSQARNTPERQQAFAKAFVESVVHLLKLK